MKKILAFGASTSSKSINKQLAHFTAQQLKNTEAVLIDLADFEMPIYSSDKEQMNGIPEKAQQLKNLIKDANGIIISFAEHNGSYSAAFKNTYDWVSRIQMDVWEQKPMLLMATSPGGRGGKTVLEQVNNYYRFVNKNTIASFSLPSFYDNFKPDTGIASEELKVEYEKAIATFEKAL